MGSIGGEGLYVVWQSAAQGNFALEFRGLADFTTSSNVRKGAAGEGAGILPFSKSNYSAGMVKNLGPPKPGGKRRVKKKH